MLKSRFSLRAYAFAALALWCAINKTTLAAPVSLEQAMSLALERNPDLQAYSSAVRSADALALQAGLLPNPTVAVDVAEFNRDGAGSDSAETSIMLGQLLELGRKRHWREQVARANGAVVNYDYEVRRQEVLAEVTARYIKLLAANERFHLAEASAELADKTRLVVLERVEAGKEPPYVALKADAELELARMDTQKAQAEIKVARQQLAALWAADEGTFDGVQGRLESVPETLPSLNELRPRLESNPELARFDARLLQGQANVSLQKAGRIPDVTVSAGYQRFAEDDTDAVAFGFSMPIPLFNRNQGNVAAAGHELTRLETERFSRELRLKTELSEAYAKLTEARQRGELLDQKILPALRTAFDSTYAGYQDGQLGFLDMLEAQRSVFETSARRVDALADYHLAATAVAKLTKPLFEKDTTNENL